MRVNIYDEEVTGEVVLVTKRASDTGRTFEGVRIFLASPDVLHDEPNDDDRSAITFWFERGVEPERAKIENMLRDAFSMAQDASEAGS